MFLWQFKSCPDDQPFTWVIRNLQPLEVTKPCRFKITVISDKDFPCMSNECNMAMALILFGLLSALFLLVFTLSSIARSRLFIRFSDLPSRHPLAFLACSDCLVLWLISPASYSAIDEMIWRTSLFAWGNHRTQSPHHSPAIYWWKLHSGLIGPVWLQLR